MRPPDFEMWRLELYERPGLLIAAALVAAALLLTHS
jgi:hypothetical protein